MNVERVEDRDTTRWGRIWKECWKKYIKIESQKSGKIECHGPKMEKN